MNADDAQKLMDHLRAHATRHAATDALRASITQRLGAEPAPDASKRAARAKAPAPHGGLSRTWAAALGFVTGAALVGVLFIAVLVVNGDQLRGRGTALESALESELVASHVRSLMVNHLTDVTSTDRHTVKPWFQGRLDYAPPVEDPAALEFPLVGGRLDVLQGRPVAALVYKHRGHTINAFIWPDSGRSDLRATAHQGFNVLRWKNGAMQYALVSDLNAQELEAFARLLREH